MLRRKATSPDQSGPLGDNVDHALRRAVAVTVRPYAILVAVLFAVLDVTYLVTASATTQAHWRLLLTADVITVVTFAVIAALGSKGRLVNGGRAHLVGAYMTSHLYVNVALLVLFRGHPFYLIALTLILVGMAPLTLTRLAWALNAASALGVLAAYTATHPVAHYAAFGYAVIVGVAVSLGWMVTQRVTIRRVVAAAAARRQAAEELEKARRQEQELAVRQRQALALHDGVAQDLTVALYALELGEVATAEQTLREAITAARRIITSAIGPTDVAEVIAAPTASAKPAKSPQTASR